MPKHKKGLSLVIATLILVLLSLVLAGVVWGVVNKIIKEKVDEVNSCFGNFEKVTINNKYTCYNYSSKELQFSISIADISIDELIVSVSGDIQTQSFKITKSGSEISMVKNYKSSDPIIKLPGENAGKTYLFNTTNIGKPSSIKIAPVINKKQCQASDELNTIDDCRIMAYQ